MKKCLLIAPVVLMVGCSSNADKCGRHIFSATDADKEVNIVSCINNRNVSFLMTKISDGTKVKNINVSVEDVRYLHSINDTSEFNALFIKGSTPIMFIDEIKYGAIVGHWTSMDMYKDKNLKEKEILALDKESVKTNISSELEKYGIRELATF